MPFVHNWYFISLLFVRIIGPDSRFFFTVTRRHHHRQLKGFLSKKITYRRTQMYADSKASFFLERISKVQTLRKHFFIHILKTLCVHVFLFFIRLNLNTRQSFHGMSNRHICTWQWHLLIQFKSSQVYFIYIKYLIFHFLNNHYSTMHT